MNYIVLDLEWNQAVTYAEMVKEPVFLTGEIVQFGAVKLNDRFEYEDTFDCRVSPQYYTEIHPRVAEVTHLDTADLKKGLKFEEAFSSFCEWCGEEITLLVWGTEDQRVLRKNMELFGFGTDYLPPCYNLQNIFAAQITQDTRQYRLTSALAVVKETPFDAHDALNDAKSTALVCKHLDLEKGLTEYCAIVENKDGVVESYEFEEEYEDVDDALSDDYVVSFECPDCNEIVWGDNWIRKNGNILVSTGTCYDGQEFLIKLKFRHLLNRKVKVKRLVYTMTEELKQDYEECVKQQEAWDKYVIPAYAC